MCSSGSLVNNPVRYSSLDASFPLNRLSFIFEMLQSGKYYLIFFYEYRNKNYLPENLFKKLALIHCCTGTDPLLFQVCSPLEIPKFQIPQFVYPILPKRPCKIWAPYGGH